MKKPAVRKITDKRPAVMTVILCTVIEMIIEALCTFTVFFVLWGLLGIEFPNYLILLTLLFVWVLNF